MRVFDTGICYLGASTILPRMKLYIISLNRSKLKNIKILASLESFCKSAAMCMWKILSAGVGLVITEQQINKRGTKYKYTTYLFTITAPYRHMNLSL